MGLLDFFARRKALSASPGVLESIRDRSWSPYPSLGGTNNQRVSAAWERGINGSYEWIYATQPAVRSVIDFIARNTAQLPLKCFERVGDTERRRDEDHPAAQTMAHPDEGTPADAFIYRLVTDYLIWDNAYFLKFRDEGTSRRVLARMPPNCVTVQGGRFTPDSYWFWRDDGSWLGPIPPQDIFHWYGYNPSDPLLGLSKLETLRQELATDSAIQSSLVELAKSGLKGGYIARGVDAPEWDADDAKRFAEQWRAMKMRSDGGDPILEEGMEFKQTGISPRDAELLASRKFTKEEVASLYGVPMEALGAATTSPTQEARRLVYADVLPPITNALTAQLDVDILQAEYGEMDYYFEFDLNAKLQGDLENRYPMMTAAAGRPWLTVNEVRALENKPPVKNGDELTIPLNVAIGDNPKPAPNVMGPQDPNKPLQDGSYREPKALNNGEIIERKRLLVTTEPRVIADMSRQKRSIDKSIGAMERHYVRQGRTLKSLKSKAQANTNRWNEELGATLTALIRSIIELEGGIHVSRFGGDDFDMRLVENYAEAMAYSSAEAINDATQRDIAALGVAEAFSRASSERAAIAGTSIGTRATFFARKEAAKQSPLSERRQMTWIKNTNRHASLDGKTVPLGSDWAGIEPGSEPNCACSVLIA